MSANAGLFNTLETVIIRKTLAPVSLLGLTGAGRLWSLNGGLAPRKKSGFRKGLGQLFCIFLNKVKLSAKD